MKFYLSSALVLMLAIAAVATYSNPIETKSMNTGVGVGYSYEDASTLKKVEELVNIDLKDASDAMQKSILVIKMASQINDTLAAYEAACQDSEEEKIKIAGILEMKMGAFESAIPSLKDQSPKEIAKLNRSVEYIRKLAKLIREAKPQHRWRDYPYMRKGFDLESASSTMRITTGGAQDAQKFRDTIDRNEVPSVSDFQAYGFINEFDLYVEGQTCDSLLCMSPVMSIDKDAKKMYLQVNLGTNVKVDKFVRRPINVGIALDLSGSMDSHDDTPRSRLDWAKDAVNETLNNLVVGQDYFTLVYFSDDAKVLWSPVDKETKKPRPITEADKAQIRATVAALKTIGSTNLRAGLDLAYSELGQVKSMLGKASDGYENRVIMITDANLNTGDTDESSAVIEVEKQSRTRGINLTTVGIGENFFAEFINKLSILRGSNYIFAQNGKRMVEYFEQFATLVTPVAYDFVADIAVDSSKAKLVRVHGVPELKAEKPKDSILNISTLFFAAPKEKGGGAQILEFDLLG